MLAELFAKTEANCPEHAARLLDQYWVNQMEHAEFDAAFEKLPEGYSEGAYEGRRFSLIVRRSKDGRRNSLFARELAGTDIVSFNLYRFTGKASLKPCEMSAGKVVAFVMGVRPDA